MKRKCIYWGLLSFVMTLSLIGFSSCSKDEPFKVNPTDISLLAEKGSSSTFMIVSSGDWQATCSVDWLHLSSTSGSGDATITLNALSSNDSDNTRTAIINVQSGDKSVSLTVSQEAKYISAYVDVNVDNMVILTTSVAFDATARGNVSYFKCSILPVSQSAGWTDEKIVSNLNSDYKLDGGTVFSIGGLTSNTDYYLFTVAFDEKGNQGPLQKYEIKTARSISNRPKISYGNIRVESGKWYWTSQMNPYTKKYYMYATDDVSEIYNFLNSTNAFIAYSLRELVNDGKISAMVQSGGWYITKKTDYFYCVSWAIGDNDVYAGDIDAIYGSLNNARAYEKTSSGPEIRKAKLPVLSCPVIYKE